MTAPLFSKRHYEWLAARCRELQSDADESLSKRIALNHFAYHIADALAGDNSRFDRDKFLRACHIRP